MRPLSACFSLNGDKNHYCVINNMSRLDGSQVSTKEHKKYVCDYCLNYFGQQELLDKHQGRQEGGGEATHGNYPGAWA